MRVIRRIGLLAVIAAAAMAVMASPASAVEISEEHELGSEHCPPVAVDGHEVTGGCALRIVSESQVEYAADTIMILCDTQFEARIDEDGNGYIYNQVIDNCSAPFFFDPCEEQGHPEPWELEVSETGVSAPEFELETRFCLVINEVLRIECHLEGIQVWPDGHDSVEYLAEDSSQIPHHLPCEEPGIAWAAHWLGVVDEEHPAIVIEHESE